MQIPKLFAELPIRNILYVSLLLMAFGFFFGSFTAQADEGGLKCLTETTGCTIEGCRNTLPNGQGYTVCNYSGTNCPPLTQCEAGDLLPD